VVKVRGEVGWPNYDMVGFLILVQDWLTFLDNGVWMW
jgi:hypothetical protein